MNRSIFFGTIRHGLFGGALDQGQVNGINAILDEWHRRRLIDLRHLAYMLATAFHETARTMQPIAEYGKGRGRKYGKPGRNAGQVAYGRGFVQLTWDDNYERADRELGLGGALTRNYDLALRPDIAAAILFRGMAEGWFTGKKLSDYFFAANADWRNARRIINGIDQAQLIAGYGQAFHAALREAALAPDVPVIPPDPPQPERSGRRAISERAAGIGALIAALLGLAYAASDKIATWFNAIFN